MKTVRYAGPATPPISLGTPDTGQFVTDNNGVVQVPDDLAEQLLEQDIWRAGGGGAKPPTIDEILAAVGDDEAEATAALVAEEARNNPRTKLVKALTAVITAAADDQADSAGEDPPADQAEADTSEED